MSRILDRIFFHWAHRSYAWVSFLHIIIKSPTQPKSSRLGRIFLTQATWWKKFCNWRSTTEKHDAQKQTAWNTGNDSLCTQAAAETFPSGSCRYFCMISGKGMDLSIGTDQERSPNLPRFLPFAATHKSFHWHHETVSLGFWFHWFIVPPHYILPNLTAQARNMYMRSDFD